MKYVKEKSIDTYDLIQLIKNILYNTILFYLLRLRFVRT